MAIWNYEEYSYGPMTIHHHAEHIPFLSASFVDFKDKGGDSSLNTGTIIMNWVSGVDYNPETQSVDMLTLYRPFEPNPLHQDAEIL